MHVFAGKMAESRQGRNPFFKNKKISIFPLDSRDFNTGRCRMDVCSMKLVGVKLNSTVCIAVKDWKFYCTVWPNLCRSFVAQNLNFDTSVVLSTDNFPDVGSLLGCCLDLLSDITPVETCVAKLIEVVVYLRVENVQEMSPRLMYDKVRRASQVRCILQDKVFTKHCWVCVKKMFNCGLEFTQEVDRIFVNNVEYYNGNKVGSMNN